MDIENHIAKPMSSESKFSLPPSHSVHYPSQSTMPGYLVNSVRGILHWIHSVSSPNVQFGGLHTFHNHSSERSLSMLYFSCWVSTFWMLQLCEKPDFNRRQFVEAIVRFSFASITCHSSNCIVDKLLSYWCSEAVYHKQDTTAETRLPHKVSTDPTTNILCTPKTAEEPLRSIRHDMECIASFMHPSTSERPCKRSLMCLMSSNVPFYTLAYDNLSRIFLPLSQWLLEIVPDIYPKQR